MKFGDYSPLYANPGNEVKEDFDEDEDNIFMPEFDSSEVSKAKKSRYMNRIVPMSLIPLATSNAMVFIGGKIRSVNDCFFTLGDFLVISGAISLSLVVLAVVSKWEFEWIFGRRKGVTPWARKVLMMLEMLGYLFTFAQVALLFFGTAFVYPKWEKYSDQKGNENYCKYEPFLFTTFLLTISWFFVIIALICYLYVKCHTRISKKK